MFVWTRRGPTYHMFVWTRWGPTCHMFVKSRRGPTCLFSSRRNVPTNTHVMVLTLFVEFEYLFSPKSKWTCFLVHPLCLNFSVLIKLCHYVGWSCKCSRSISHYHPGPVDVPLVSACVLWHLTWTLCPCWGICLEKKLSRFKASHQSDQCMLVDVQTAFTFILLSLSNCL